MHIYDREVLGNKSVSDSFDVTCSNYGTHQFH